MIVPQEIVKGLWTFPIIMPNNPLKWLNSYVIKDENGGRNLLIDCGFRMKACFDALMEGIEALGLDMQNTDVFFTHFHGDHAGNARRLENMGARTFISREDLRSWRYLDEADYENYVRCLTEEGLPHDLLPFLLYKPKPGSDGRVPDNIRTLDEGDVLRYGNFVFECISTPGHTPGHMCLYDREKKLIILGDHVLFDVSPNITSDGMMPDALGSYLESLRKIRDLPVEIALPGHRNRGEISLAERVDRLLAHHERRLAEMERLIIQAENGITAYELTSGLRWKIRANSWEEFPDPQKCFAFGETLAHLDYLVARDRVEKERHRGKTLYFAK